MEKYYIAKSHAYNVLWRDMRNKSHTPNAEMKVSGDNMVGKCVKCGKEAYHNYMQNAITTGPAYRERCPSKY
jgi:hypothetical protein